MIVIGVDPHKSSHTATAVDAATATDLGSVRIPATLTDYDHLIEWARSWPERTWAVENASGLGHHLAQWLLARGEHVLDVPATATARIRELSRGGGRKNDRIDAAAAAGVAAVQNNAYPVVAEDHTDSLKLLDERREHLTRNRVATVNQLHALLRELLAGGVPTHLTAKKATAALAALTPHTGTDTVRAQVCADLVEDLIRLDRALAANKHLISEHLDRCGTTLRDIPGIADITAGRIIGRTGHPDRFANVGAYATYTGTAPIEIASADYRVHRLSRYGDRTLNSAIHTAAMVQARMPDTAGHAYYAKKRAEGKTPRAAARALKRHLAAHVWRTMIADQRRTQTTAQSHPSAA